MRGMPGTPTASTERTTRASRGTHHALDETGHRSIWAREQILPPHRGLQFKVYPVVHKLADISSCSRNFGVPTEIVSNNGPQFVRHTYKDMCTDWSITHTTSSPHGENGQICIEEVPKKSRDVNKALLNLCATPVDAHLPAPAKILYGRPVYTTLPGNIPSSTLQKSREINDRL